MTDTRAEPTVHEDTQHDKAVRPVRLFGMPYTITFVVITAIWALLFLTVDLAG